MIRPVVTVLACVLVLTAGCSGMGDGGVATPTPSVTPSPTTHTATPLEQASPTPVPAPGITAERGARLDEFARATEQVFRAETNLTRVTIERERGSATIVTNVELPPGSDAERERLFETVLVGLVKSQSNWVVNGSREYLADRLTVSTAADTGTITDGLLQRCIDEALAPTTAAYIWAGRFDRYTPLGDLDNDSHASRADRLAYTAHVVERRMETQKPHTTAVETAVENETLYVAYRHTKSTPNPTWSIGDTVRAYRETVTEFGVEYMPYNGVRGYDYHPNGTADVTFVVKNPWITSEYVGLRPTGEGSLNAANSLTIMGGPHDGPP